MIAIRRTAAEIQAEIDRLRTDLDKPRRRPMPTGYVVASVARMEALKWVLGLEES